MFLLRQKQFNLVTTITIVKTIIKLFEKIILYPICALVLLIARLLSPFLIIRFVAFDIGRYGGVHRVDIALSEKKDHTYKVPRFDIFYRDSSAPSISNNFWYEMWSREIKFIGWSYFPRFVKLFINVCKIFNLDKFHHCKTPFESRQTPLIMKTLIKCSTQTNLHFTDIEIKKGLETLKSWGITNEFICFHSRGPAYLDKFIPQNNWRYHDYRDSNIDNYLEAAEKLTQTDLYALRVGSIVEKKINTNNQKIIDYANNGQRSQFMDIFLSAHCKFFICSDAGISTPPEIFRKPIIITNWINLARIPIFINNLLLIPKKIFSKEKNRLLTLPEIIRSPVGWGVDGSYFEKNNLTLIENTPEEIADVSLEMNSRLDKTWVETEEDIQLQKQFWIYFGDRLPKNEKVKIGAHFLRKNQDLLKDNA